MYSSQGSHIQQYKVWAELKDLKRTPTFGENMGFFFSYQVNWMYWRYFMWNFAGKQNDTQGHGDFVDGNWKTGIGFYDEARLGNQEFVPELSKNSKANNSYYMITRLIGLLGLVYQLLRHRSDFIVVGLLFVLTGFAIVVYLNQTPLQPRERDYAYAGSFYAFAIWIGLGVTAIYFWLKLVLKKIPSTAIAGLAFGLTLVAPILMAAQGWDDHDRSDRRTGIDMAKNYLNSLQPNAIIFTNGDNDTFPLWYAQELRLFPSSTIIIMDDDPSVQAMWRQRFSTTSLMQKEIRIIHFSNPDEVLNYYQNQNHSERTSFLLDYEILGFGKTGLDLIEDLKISRTSLLVTSRWEDPSIQERCRKSQIRVLPKYLAGFVPIEVQIPESRPDAVLLDDDALVIMTWKNVAAKNQRQLLAFSDPNEFFETLKALSRSTPIFVDSELSDGIKGQDLIPKISALGFEAIFITSGHDSSKFNYLAGLAGIIGKDPPPAIGGRSRAQSDSE
jgi:FixJ family two-component response regulator